MVTAQEGPALGQVSWDREQWYRRASSGIDRHVQGVAQSFLNLGSGGSRGSSPGGTGQDENRFLPLHGRAGHGPTHHPGPLHHHDTAVGCDLRGRGFVPLPQDPLPYQDEDPLLEQLSPYGELGSGGAGGHRLGGQPAGGGNASVPSSCVCQVVSVISCFGLWFPRSMMVVEMATTA